MPCQVTAWRELVAPTNHPAQAHQVESIGAVVGVHAQHSDNPARAAEPFQHQALARWWPCREKRQHGANWWHRPTIRRKRTRLNPLVLSLASTVTTRREPLNPSNIKPFTQASCRAK
jgi:hypothetical protein